MICAYCGKEKRGTKEHIISSSVLDLFPECNITIDSDRKKSYANDPVIKDVCAECNNKRISYIDSYAKSMVESFFIKKYEPASEVAFEYDYVLIQKMFIKYAFNDSRSRHYDISFFNQEVIDWLANAENQIAQRNITIMAGLAINTSPVPDFVFGNRKIRWCRNPLLLSNSIIDFFDSDTGRMILRESNDIEHLQKQEMVYLFRLNSLQVILIGWNPNISDEELLQNLVFLRIQYPYTILDIDGKSTLKRCTSEITFHYEKLIDVTWGQGIFDDVSYMRGTFSDESQDYFKAMEQEWEKEERLIRESNLRKQF